MWFFIFRAQLSDEDQFPLLFGNDVTLRYTLNTKALNVTDVYIINGEFCERKGEPDKLNKYQLNKNAPLTEQEGFLQHWDVMVNNIIGHEGSNDIFYDK